MDLREDIIYPILITATYFLGVYLFFSATITAYTGLIVASVVTLLAVLWLAWLRHIGMADRDLPVFFLAVVFPFVALVCGVIAWIVRLLGESWGLFG